MRRKRKNVAAVISVYRGEDFMKDVKPVKKSARIMAILCACMILLGTGTVLAYFTDGDFANNKLVIGSNTIQPEEPFDPVEPGKKIIKAPRGVNTGRVPCYVRAKILLTDSRAKDYITYYTDNTEGLNTAVWTQDTDGWMYFKNSIEPKEKTDPLFTHIKLHENLPNEVKDVGIDVVFESVQIKSFKDAKTAFKSVEGNREEGGIRQ